MKSGTVSIQIDVRPDSLDAGDLEDLVRRVAEVHSFAIASVSVVLTGHDLVGNLNEKYLNSTETTDVLAFDLRDENQLADTLDGEVYVDVETAFESFEEYGSTVEDEIRRYIVHGLLHLIGFRDKTPEGKSEMHRLEDEILFSS